MTRSERLDSRVADQQQISRNKAAALIMAGQVRVNGQPARKPGQTIQLDAPITVSANPAVSRAGGKLAAALDAWSISVSNLIALDVGSSTGGFTEELLERGAGKVYAVDVGTGQLAWKLRQDERVVSMEQTDIRNIASLPEQPEIVVIDVSFTSLRNILSAITRLCDQVTVIALFKPQFEVGKAVADKTKGIIRDEEVIVSAIREFTEWAGQHGWDITEVIASPVVGAKGNRERLLRLTRLH